MAAACDGNVQRTLEHKDLAASANGRTSGKSWKLTKTATARSQSSAGHKTKWHARMEKTRGEHAVKKLESELKEEKRSEKQRKREITLQRQRASEERRRLEQEKIIMGARKSARLRQRAGRTRKING